MLNIIEFPRSVKVEVTAEDLSEYRSGIEVFAAGETYIVREPHGWHLELLSAAHHGPFAPAWPIDEVDAELLVGLRKLGLPLRQVAGALFLPKDFQLVRGLPLPPDAFPVPVAANDDGRLAA